MATPPLSPILDGAPARAPAPADAPFAESLPPGPADSPALWAPGTGRRRIETVERGLRCVERGDEAAAAEVVAFLETGGGARAPWETIPPRRGGYGKA